MTDLRELIKTWKARAKRIGHPSAHAGELLLCADELERALAAQPATVPEGIPVHEVKALYHHYVNTLESARDQIISRGGYCDPVDVMEKSDPVLSRIRNLIAAAAPSPDHSAGAGKMVPEAQAGADDERVELDIADDGTLTYMDGRPVQVETPKPAEGGAVDYSRAKRAIEARNEWLENHPGDAVGGMLAALNTSPATAGSGEAVAWQYRTDLDFDGNYDDWTPISRAEYDFRVSILRGRDSAPMAGTWGSTQNPLREDRHGWHEQVRALYTAPTAGGEALRKFHDFFSDKGEALFLHFGLDAVNAYNAVNIARAEGGE